MARKIKKKHKTGKRRVGAISRGGVKEALLLLVSATAGVMAGRFLNSTTMVSKIDGKLVGLAEAGVGTAIAVKVKNTKAKAFGLGLGAAGVWYGLGNKGLALLPAAIGYGPDSAALYSPGGMAGYRQVPKIGFPKPGNIGFPKPGNIGATDKERQRTARMYAGVYN